jgi:hypothetical protein
MPFKSHAQESFLKHHHPAIYKRWLGEHGHYKGKKLHVKEGADMLNFPERVVETLQISALALQKAEQEAHEKTAAERRYATKIASAVERCVKCGRIDDTQDEREKLAAWLATPEGALEVIEKLAEHEVAPQTAAAFGQQVDANGRPAGGSTKKASYDSVNDNYVGRRTGQEPESWRRLTAGLGVA